MAREDPWRTLRARSDLELRWAELPDGMGGMWTPGAIILDDRLDRVERRCKLMHEIVHSERRIGWPFATAATMETEERIVRVEAALRLVPLGELHRFLIAMEGHELALPHLVAEEFDVTPQVAHTAVQTLNRRLLEHELAQASRRMDPGDEQVA